MDLAPQADLLGVYASLIQVTANPSEVILILGQFGVPELGGSDPGQPRMVGHVRLSPQTAKLFSLSLSKVMEAYDKQFGKVELPDALRTAASADPVMSSPGKT